MPGQPALAAAGIAFDQQRTFQIDRQINRCDQLFGSDIGFALCGCTWMTSSGRTLIFRPSDIWWAKAASNYVEIQTETGMHLVRISLSELETLIGKIEPSHVRCHRSYLVQVSQISKITPRGNGSAELELASGRVLPIGRSYRVRVERLIKGD